MNSSHWMVVLIVAIVMIASVLRAKYSGRGRHHAELSPQDQSETLRLREEVKELKERLKVLERITVEKENSLAKEIEALRDR
jgi:phage shock protein B